LEKGRIVEQGNHEHLLKANGYYAKLHSYQNHTPVLRQVPGRDETHPPHKSTERGSVERGNREIIVKHAAEKGLGVVSSATEIEEVDESWAIEMLEALDKEERENETRSKP
jgi:hypothetical protein